jgi:uncharacterized protein (DUF362 family)
MNVLDQIYPSILIPDAFHGANIVHLPTVKCHIYTTTTGAMKNAFGGLLVKRRKARGFADADATSSPSGGEIHSGLFAVMDGTTAGDEPSPRVRPVIKDVISRPTIRLRSTRSPRKRLMGFDP